MYDDENDNDYSRFNQDAQADLAVQDDIDDQLDQLDQYYQDE